MDDPGGELRVVARALARGEWRDAAAALGQAHAAAAARGEVADAARCAEMASVLRRRSGDPGRALEGVVRGGFVGGDELSGQFMTVARRAEDLVVRGEDAAAAAEYAAVVHIGVRLDLPGWVLGSLERRRADRLSASGEPEAAWRAFDAAADRHRLAGDEVAAGWVALEHANRAWASGHVVHGLQVASRLDLERTARTDLRLRSELAVSRGRLWLASGDPRAAAAEAGAALDTAVTVGAAMSILPAALLLAGIREGQGDEAEAWAVLEAARGALTHLLGDRLSRGWLEPTLEEVRERWGVDRFEVIRAEHARVFRGILRPATRRSPP